MPVSAGTPSIWPEGSTWEQASEWWATVRRDAEQNRLVRRSAAIPRPAPVSFGTGRSYFLHFRHPADRREAGKTAQGFTCPPFASESIKGTQPMKPKKPMIILGTILRAEKQSMTDKTDKSKTSEMFQLVISDATKPVQFRTTSQFIHFTTPDKVRAAFGTDNVDDLADEKVTFAASEIAPYNAFLKLKGQMVKGHQSGEQLQKMTAAAAEAKAQAAASAPPAQPPAKTAK